MIGAPDYRDPITQSLLQRQALARRQQQQQPTGPFAPPPRPLPPAPMMGTPPPRQQEQSPYGFQSGFNAAGGGAAAPYDPRRKEGGWSDLYAKLFGSGETAGSGAP